MMNTRFYLCGWLGIQVYAWLTNSQCHAACPETETVAIFHEVGGEMKMYEAKVWDLLPVREV